MPVKILNKPNPYEQHLTGTPAQGTTTVHHVKNMGGGVKDEKLMDSKQEILSKPLLMPKDQAHMVEVGGGLTINLGNFESCRIDVRLTVPCTKSDIEEAYEWASSWVSEKLKKASDDAKGL